MKTDSNCYKILLVLQHAPAGGMTNAEIAAHSAINKAVADVSVYTRTLVDRELAERKTSAGDVARYTITAAGEALIAAGGVEGDKKAPRKKSKKAKARKTKKPTPRQSTPILARTGSKDVHFRCGIFNDGGLQLLAAAGTLLLSDEEARELAGFCALHFAEE